MVGLFMEKGGENPKSKSKSIAKDEEKKDPPTREKERNEQETIGKGVRNGESVEAQRLA